MAALAALLYVLFPLFKEAFWPFLGPGELSELQRARKEGLMAIADVDSEYEMGKLTQEDYAVLRESLKGEVIPVLKRQKLALGEGAAHGGNHLRPGLKKDILREVIRICGTKERS